jgi:hypothetical protein
MYRATPTDSIASETHPDLCFAVYSQDAIGYLCGCNGDWTHNGGVLHIGTVTDWDKIASWGEALEVWESAGLSVYSDCPMVCADNAELRAALAAAGYEGMIYDDEGPENRYQHETIRVWGSSCWKIVRTEPIPPGDTRDI